MNTALFEVAGLSVVYNTGRRRHPKVALRDVSVSIDAGETVGIVGESGSGKSSLANAMMGLVPAASGACLFMGRDIAKLDRSRMKEFRKSVQMVFQDPFASLNPRLTVGDAIAEVIRFHNDGPASTESVWNRVSGLLRQVELTASHALRYPHELSGGQRQRVVLARALAVDPVMLVADEPVSALDVLVQQQILSLLSAIQRERCMALVLIAHDLAVAHQACRRQVVLFGGTVMESGPSSLLVHPAHPYTRDLLAAVPSVKRGLARSRVAGTPSSRAKSIDTTPEDADGCPYRLRCGMATDRCSVETPELLLVGQDHLCRCHFGGKTSTTTASIPTECPSCPTWQRTAVQENHSN
jgi:oligopeptide/dipeptide ABC transporter ATP-binding protein